MPPPRVEDWVQRLLDGEDGARIVDEMEHYYSTDCTIISKVSYVRKMYMQAVPGPGQSNTHPTLAATLEKPEKAASSLGSDNECARLVRLFLEAPLHIKYRESRKRPPLKEDCRYTEEIQQLFAEMKVLPDSMDSFRVDQHMVVECIEDNPHDSPLALGLYSLVGRDSLYRITLDTLCSRGAALGRAPVYGKDPGGASKDGVDLPPIRPLTLAVCALHPPRRSCVSW